MPFLTQGNQNNCGAFCICYLNWLDRGRTPAGGPQNNDQAMVDEVYNFVQMGDSAQPDDPPDYCDAVRMMALLQLLYNISFYADPTQDIYNTIKTLHLDVGARDKAFMDILEATGKLHEAPPPEPQDWEGPMAALAVYEMLNAAGTVVGKHCILFRRGPGGEIYRYNPWDGMAVAANGYDGFVSHGFTLVPAGTAILVNN